MIIVDSDILIWHLRGLRKITDEVKRLTDNDLLYTSPVVIAEIYAGAKKKEEVMINNLFSSMKKVTINEEIGKKAGEFLNKFSKSHSLEIPDALIAASSIASEMQLWTLNKKHYPMLKKKDFYEI